MTWFQFGIFRVTRLNQIPIPLNPPRCPLIRLHRRFSGRRRHSVPAVCVVCGGRATIAMRPATAHGRDPQGSWSSATHLASHRNTGSIGKSPSAAPAIVVVSVSNSARSCVDTGKVLDHSPCPMQVLYRRSIRHLQQPAHTASRRPKSRYT